MTTLEKIFHISAWSKTGELIINDDFSKKTIILTEHKSDGDFASDTLAGKTVFVTTKLNGLTVLVDSDKGAQKSFSASFGESILVGDVNICVTITESQNDSDQENLKNPNFYQDCYWN